MWSRSGVTDAVPTGQVLAGLAPISRANRRIVLQEWLAEAFTMWGVAAVVIAVTAAGGAGSRSGIWVYRAAAGLLVALWTLIALTGARTPVVWFKICPVLLAGGALRRAPGPPHRGRLRMLGSSPKRTTRCGKPGCGSAGQTPVMSRICDRRRADLSKRGERRYDRPTNEHAPPGRRAADVGPPDVKLGEHGPAAVRHPSRHGCRCPGVTSPGFGSSVR
jgi:hypothetical protein